VEQHFLQQEPWGEFQRALGREVIEKSGDGWSYLAIVERGKFTKRLYCPYGPTAENAVVLQNALDNLKDEAKQRKLDFVRVEPIVDGEDGVIAELSTLGYRKGQHVQPEDTALVDVDLETDDEIAAKTHKRIRSHWRKCLREGLVIRQSNDPQDVEIFLDMIHDVSNRTHMSPHEDDYFRLMAKVLFPRGCAGMLIGSFTETSEYGKSENAASLIYFKNKSTVYYAHAGSYTKYRKLSPATAVLLELLFFARTDGCKTVDMYGIAPENAPADHPWNGFTEFKIRYGAKRKHYLGTWEKPVGGLLKHMKYGLFSKLNK
jgi:lipid II:glycine glycyltransferase (peptidoglycan interpeptide bridge formation enzyme)